MAQQITTTAPHRQDLTERVRLAERDRIELDKLQTQNEKLQRPEANDPSLLEQARQTFSDIKSSFSKLPEVVLNNTSECLFQQSERFFPSPFLKVSPEDMGSMVNLRINTIADTESLFRPSEFGYDDVFEILNAETPAERQSVLDFLTGNKEFSEISLPSRTRGEVYQEFIDCYTSGIGNLPPEEAYPLANLMIKGHEDLPGGYHFNYDAFTKNLELADDFLSGKIFSQDYEAGVKANLLECLQDGYSNGGQQYRRAAAAEILETSPEKMGAVNCMTMKLETEAFLASGTGKGIHLIQKAKAFVDSHCEKAAVSQKVQQTGMKI